MQAEIAATVAQLQASEAEFAVIPLKTIDFAGGVNLTLGLPFVRASPDHGTALDIAGRGEADPASLIAALRIAREMARNRARAAEVRAAV